jgi:hypothetical protein
MKNKKIYIKNTIEFLKWLLILTGYFYSTYIICIIALFINWGRISEHRINMFIMTFLPVLFLIFLIIKNIKSKNLFRVYMFLFFIIYEIFLPMQDYYNIEEYTNMPTHVEKSLIENIKYFFHNYYGKALEKHTRRPH